MLIVLSQQISKWNAPKIAVPAIQDLSKKYVSCQHFPTNLDNCCVFQACTCHELSSIFYLTSCCDLLTKHCIRVNHLQDKKMWKRVGFIPGINSKPVDIFISFEFFLRSLFRFTFIAFHMLERVGILPPVQQTTHRKIGATVDSPESPDRVSITAPPDSTPPFDSIKQRQSAVILFCIYARGNRCRTCD